MTEYQIGYMAIGVGFLAGYGVRILGKGVDKSFQYAGAALSLAGCLAGNLAVIVVMASMEIGVGTAELVARLTPGIIIELYKATFNAMDLVFYALALSVGYRMSLRSIPQSELDKLLQE
jgi:hypothetical protein